MHEQYAILSRRLLYVIQYAQFVIGFLSHLYYGCDCTMALRLPETPFVRLLSITTLTYLSNAQPDRGLNPIGMNFQEPFTPSLW